jgi:hypothetical protein
MANSQGRSSRVELGLVRTSPKDAALVQQARIRLTRWFEREPASSDNRYRPARLGVILSQRQFSAWAVRYGVVRAEHRHNAWPARIFVPERRLEMLQGRNVLLGACRVDPTEAKAFRKACLSFFEAFCAPTEDINQSKFLTLAVVGFAECVMKTAALHNLPVPPWSGPSLFKELPSA